MFLVAVIASHQSFDGLMEGFEFAKKDRDFAKRESILIQALKIRVTDYAAGSLVWSQLNQGKSAEALDSARRMISSVGETPYAMASLIDACLHEGEWDTAKKASLYSVQKGLDQGQDWTNNYLRSVISRDNEMNSPAKYRLHWTIPGEAFKPSQKFTRFRFPLLNTSEQTFEFHLTGQISYRIVESTDIRAIVEIVAQPGQAVEVDGTATIKSEQLGAKTIRRLGAIALTPAPSSETGLLYYGSEPHDPKTPEIQPVVQQVRRKSAAETVQAIIDWRAKDMPYETLPGGDENHLARIMRYKRGVCHDASYMTASLARACGIPAFVIGGYVLPQSGSFKKVEGSHGWISVYLPTVGWVNVDSLAPDSLTLFGRSNYLRFTRQGERDNDASYVSLQGYLISGQRM